MDYFKKAFGGFDPQRDEDAALKLILEALAADHRLEDLSRLMRAEPEIHGVEGEPGWLLERLDEPEGGSVFRASIDPAAYHLAHPSFECSSHTLTSYMTLIQKAYRSRHSA